MKTPTKKEMIESCERTGAPYYFQVSVWNRDGEILMSVKSPMTKTYGKRLAKIQMEGFLTSGGLKVLRDAKKAGKGGGKRGKK